MTEGEGLKLPIKLRYKQEGRSSVSEVPTQKEAEKILVPQSAVKNAKIQLSRPSKIAGTATKTKPRIGSEFQADIPEYKPHSSKGQAD